MATPYGRLSSTLLQWSTAGVPGTYMTITPTTDSTLTFTGTGSNTVTLRNVDEPVINSDAANKFYVDSLVAGLTWKQPVQILSTSTVNLLNPQTSSFDGFAPTDSVSGTRVLVPNQTDGLQNGIYYWYSAGVPMTRTPDFPMGGNLVDYSGSSVFVQQGNSYGNTAWTETADTGLIGATTITWVQFASSGAAFGTDPGMIQYRGATPGSFLASTNFMFDNFTNVLNITGSEIVTGNGSFGSLSVTSNGTFGSISTTSMTVSGPLNTVGPTTLAGSVNVSGTAIFATTFVGGAGGLNTQIQFQNSSGSFDGSSGLTWTTGTNTLNATNITSTSATITNISASTITAGYISVTSLSITAPLNFTNLTVTTLNVTGPSSFAGPNTLGGATNITGTLTVTSNATFNGSISATSIITSGNVSVGGLLSAPTATFSNLNVTGPTTLSGPSVFQGSSTFTGSVVMPTTFVGGAAGSNTELQFNNSGNFGASSDLTWNGTTLSAGNLVVTTNATFNGHVKVDMATLSGSVDSSVGTILEIDAQTYTMNNNAISFTSRVVFNSIASSTIGSTTGTVTDTVANLYIGAPIVATSQTVNNKYALLAEGNVNVGGGGVLSATSASITNISASTITAGYISVTSLSITAPLNFTNLTVTTLNVTGPSSFAGPNTLGGATNITGTLTVTSNATFEGSISATSILTSGNVSVGGLLSAPTATFSNLNVTGPTTLSGPSVFQGLSTFTGSVIMPSTFTGGAAGSNTWVQFNQGNNTFGANSDFTWTTATNTLGLGISGSGTISLGVDSTISANASTFTMNSTNAAINADLFSTIATGTVSIGGSNATNNVIIKGTQEAVDRNSGALIVKGGLGVTGNVFATELYSVSDAQYKTNIVPLHDSLTLLRKIEGYSYDWKQEYKGFNSNKQIGVIAQQLEDVGLGNLVSNGASKSVNYLGLIPILIEAVKELSERFDQTL